MPLSKMPTVEEIIRREIAKRQDVLWSFAKENVLLSALVYCECFEMFFSVWLDLHDKIKWGYLKFSFFFFETGNCQRGNRAKKRGWVGGRIITPRKVGKNSQILRNPLKYAFLTISKTPYLGTDVMVLYLQLVVRDWVIQCVASHAGVFII